MPRNRRSTNGETGCDLSGSQLARLEVLQYLPPSGVSKSLEYSSVVIHIVILANMLTTDKGLGLVGSWVIPDQRVVSVTPASLPTDRDRRFYSAATQLISTTAPSSNNSVTPTAVQAG